MSDITGTVSGTDYQVSHSSDNPFIIIDKSDKLTRSVYRISKKMTYKSVSKGADSVVQEAADGKVGLVGKITPQEIEDINCLLDIYNSESDPAKKSTLYRFYENAVKFAQYGYIKDASLKEVLSGSK
jgi:hypothetical protein